MKYIEFGKKKTALSQIIVGLMRISKMTTEELAYLIDGALDAGINAFDIADIYANGHCESLLGETLASRPDLKKKMWIQSKCGIRDEGFTFFDFSKDHILEAVDQILLRLKTDHLDSLLLHRQDAGIVRDSSIFEYCRLHDMVIQAWSPLQHGYFEGVFLGSDKYPELNKVLNRLAEEKGVTPTAIAFAWVLRYPGTMQAVTGTTKVSRIREAAAATDIRLDRKEWYEIYLSAGNDLP